MGAVSAVTRHPANVGNGRKAMKARLIFAATAIFACSQVLVGGATAQGTPADLTTFLPSYQTISGYMSGIEPGFSETFTPNYLTIVSGPDLPAATLAPQNNISSTISVTGNFSATVTSTVTPYSGGVFNAQVGGGYAGVAWGSKIFGWEASNVYVNYGFGNAFVDTPATPYTGSPTVLDLSRIGDVLSFYYSAGTTGFTKLFSLSGPSVSGPAGFDLTGFGSPGESVTGTTTFTNLTITRSPPGALTLPGGDVSSPTALPDADISQLSGTIGGPGGTSDFYSFHWNGGTFEALVGVLLATAPTSFEFELCGGTSCVSDVLQEVVADSADGWQNALSGDLSDGYYTVGIIEDGPGDPQYNFTFATPLTASVPETSTWAMMLLGFASLGFAGYRRARRPRSQADRFRWSLAEPRRHGL
jgi:hypothetical protein